MRASLWNGESRSIELYFCLHCYFHEDGDDADLTWIAIWIISLRCNMFYILQVVVLLDAILAGTTIISFYSLKYVFGLSIYHNLEVV